MESKGKIKQCLLLMLCIVTAFGVLTQAAGAKSTSVATGRCLNIVNEGVEFFQPTTFLADEANEWRKDLEVSAELPDTTSAGQVIAMELETTTDSTRYQCTQINVSPAIFSCNSLPKNAVINGVYFRFIPNTSVTENTDLKFIVKEVANPLVLLESETKMQFPPTPCARNYITKDFVAPDGSALVYNTSAACTDHKFITAQEQEEPFAIVNIINGDNILDTRLRMNVTPSVDYSYTMYLFFRDATGSIQRADYSYNGVTHVGTLTTPLWDAAIPQTKLPLKLESITVDGISTTHTDMWGNPDYPSATDFRIRFHYENTEGTLGYENSLFHFERNMHVLFAPYCDADVTTTVLTGIATAKYDQCQASLQMFSIDLTDSNGVGIVVPRDATQCSTYSHYCADTSNLTPPGIADYSTNGHVIPERFPFYFATRRCVDAACESYTGTHSYPYSLTFSDGLNLFNTYTATSYSGSGAGSGGISRFDISAYEDTALGRPFAINGMRFVTDTPGTYVVFGFVKPSDAQAEDLKHYAVKFYVTVNQSDQMTSCYTLANNGYFRAYWNDCLGGNTQLMTFEHIDGTEEAWMRNSSAHGVHFPYFPEWSYLPQKLEVGSLTCRFEALSAAGRPADGYCTPEDVYVPPYTKVTITGGTIYLEGGPSYDEYWVAYAREETHNISHLIMSIQTKACENKKIPDTGISLRSPLKVQESVDAETSYVFTGNSLRIPAVGLGMETPIPIVHVYYENDDPDRGWDLSTLGNYVGELEGGAYIPYGGNSVLTGHFWSGGVFRNLENLNYEDEIIIFANNGLKYVYKVVEKFIAQPDDVYQMFQPVGDTSLTLVTCENYNLITDEYERRYIVRAVLDSTDTYTVNW